MESSGNERGRFFLASDTSALQPSSEKVGELELNLGWHKLLCEEGATIDLFYYSEECLVMVPPVYVLFVCVYIN